MFKEIAEGADGPHRLLPRPLPRPPDLPPRGLPRPPLPLLVGPLLVELLAAPDLASPALAGDAFFPSSLASRVATVASKLAMHFLCRVGVIAIGEV